jgi:hypothetical protein
MFETWVDGRDDVLMIGKRLAEFIWGEHQDTVTVNYLCDGWSAFRARWFPDWLLNYCEPYYCEKIICTAEEIYPRLKISLPEETHRVILSK